MKKSGLSLIELVIAVSLIGVLSLSLFSIFQNVILVWTKGRSGIEAVRDLSSDNLFLDQKLKKAAQIIQVSLTDSIDGFIQYKTVDNETISVFRNTEVNRSMFVDNSFPTNNIVVSYNDGDMLFPVELIVNNVFKFKVYTYTEDLQYIQRASPNNTIAPISYDQISSVRFSILKQEAQVSHNMVRLVALDRARLNQSGDIQFDFKKSSLDNIAILSGATESDAAAAIATHNYIAKIKNSGLYFLDIQQAINQAVSGNEVLVTKGRHRTSLILKAGVILKGGYAPVSWDRNIYENQTIISTEVSLLDAAIEMKTGSQLDGLTIDGNDVQYGVLVQDAENVSIQHVAIENCDFGIFCEYASGSIMNNSITANTTTVYLNNSDQIKLYRNRLFSNNNNLQPNVVIKKSDEIELKNNLIKRGDDGIQFSNSSASLMNNVVTEITNIAVNLPASGNAILMAYNVFYDNNFGIFGRNTNMSVSYNYFAFNDFGNYGVKFPGALGVGNIEDDPVESPFEDLDAYESSESYPTLKNNGMGLYEGQQAGRVGVGHLHYVDPTDTYQDIINTAYAGDIIKFKPGTFNLTNALTLKKNMILLGSLVDYTILDYTADSAGIWAVTQNQLEDFSCRSSSEAVAIYAQSQSNITIKNILFKAFSRAVVINNSSKVLISNCTFVGNNTGILMSAANQTNHLYFSILSSCNTEAIKVQAGTLAAYYTLFHNNTVNVNEINPGVVVETETIDSDPDPGFWDPLQDDYHLRPTTDAKDVSQNIDVGCFEVYEATGLLTTEVLASDLNRSYQSLQITLFGDPGDYPSMNPYILHIEPAIVFKNRFSETVVTLSPSIMVTHNAIQNLEWNLSPNTISDRIAVRVFLRSHRYSGNLYINSMRLVW